MARIAQVIFVSMAAIAILMCATLILSAETAKTGDVVIESVDYLKAKAGAELDLSVKGRYMILPNYPCQK